MLLYTSSCTHASTIMQIYSCLYSYDPSDNLVPTCSMLKLLASHAPASSKDLVYLMKCWGRCGTCQTAREQGSWIVWHSTKLWTSSALHNRAGRSVRTVMWRLWNRASHCLVCLGWRGWVLARILPMVLAHQQQQASVPVLVLITNNRECHHQTG